LGVGGLVASELNAKLFVQSKNQNDESQRSNVRQWNEYKDLQWLRRERRPHPSTSSG
jgi:hypothetical protein